MSEYRKVPVELIKASVHQLIIDDDKTLDCSLEFLKALAEEIKSVDPFCDHSVGICQCETIGILDELLLVIDNKRSCPDCVGDGFIFVTMRIDPEYGEYEEYDKCPNCDGKGTVELNAD